MDLFMPKSALQERIENATAENLVSEDKNELLKICDYITTLADGPKDALKGIKKRLKHKNPKVNLMALELLDTAVKNCGERFHVQVVSKDFLPDYVKILKTAGLNKAVKDKMLDLVQLWSVGFAANDALTAALDAHSQLLNEGIEFPPRDFDSFVQYSPNPRISPVSMASINSERATHNIFVPKGAPGVVLRPGEPGAANRYPQPRSGEYPGQVYQQPQPAQGPITSEKIREHIESMQATLELFAETLAFINPEVEDVTRHEFIQECHERCKRWQQHLTGYLQNCTDDSLFEPLLQLNDAYNARFDYYNECAARYASLNSGGSRPNPASSMAPPVASYSPAPAPARTQPQPQQQPQQEVSLISFYEESPAPSSSSGQPPQQYPSYPYAMSSTSFSSSQPAPQPNDLEMERLQIKDILGVDPDEFNEDQVNNDLASLGFTREQLMDMKLEDTGEAEHEEGQDTIDEFEKLIDQRLSKSRGNDAE